MYMLTTDELGAALACRDLTDPAGGPHAIQIVMGRLELALAKAWTLPVRRNPGHRVVPVADNYDRLGYSPAAATRDSRYTRYVEPATMLRSHTTAAIPALLKDVATETVVSVPGMTYRRDVIDRLHTGMPHQHDLWRIRPVGPGLEEDDLEEMITAVVEAVLPGRAWRTIPAVHPYTVAGREIYVRDGDSEVEIGECGIADPQLLSREGLRGGSGLALGLGLDRLVMLAKGIPDIRLLRSNDPRIAGQMLDLLPYQPVSVMPATVRDLSLVVESLLDPELLGDRVGRILGSDADAIESVEVLQRTAYPQLPAAAIARMGMRSGQDNVLLRLVIRHPSRTLTAQEANLLRDRVYGGLHEGSVGEWASTAQS